MEDGIDTETREVCGEKFGLLLGIAGTAMSLVAGLDLSRVIFASLDQKIVRVGGVRAWCAR